MQDAPFSSLSFWIVISITIFLIFMLVVAGLLGVALFRKNNNPNALTMIIKQVTETTTLLRLVTVIIIIYAGVVLAATNKMDAPIASLLSGITGFVLGGLNHSENSRTKDND